MPHRITHQPCVYVGNGARNVVGKNDINFLHKAVLPVNGSSWEDFVVPDPTEEDPLQLVGNPVGYIRPDGSEHIFCKEEAAAGIHDVVEYWSPRQGRWFRNNLTTATGIRFQSDPFAFVDSEGHQHVIGRMSTGLLAELRWTPAQDWQVEPLSLSVQFQGRPFGYGHPDGSSHVFCRRADNDRIAELYLPPGGTWTMFRFGKATADFGPDADSDTDPVGCLGPDGSQHVVFRKNNEIRLLSWTRYAGWSLTTLGTSTTIDNTPCVLSTPSGTLHVFATSAIGSSSNLRLHEFSWSTVQAQGTPARGGWNEETISIGSGGGAAETILHDPVGYVMGNRVHVVGVHDDGGGRPTQEFARDPDSGNWRRYNIIS